jgi:hypothetical protein
MEDASVIYFGSRTDGNIRKLAESLSDGIERQGISVRCIDGDRCIGDKISSRYIAVVAAPESGLGISIPLNVKRFLEQAGNMSGKRSFAFIASRGLRKQKNLLELMSIMESEGLYLKRSEILKTPDQAQTTGSELHIIEKKV